MDEVGGAATPSYPVQSLPATLATSAMASALAGSTTTSLLGGQGTRPVDAIQTPVVNDSRFDMLLYLLIVTVTSLVATWAGILYRWYTIHKYNRKVRSSFSQTSKEPTVICIQNPDEEQAFWKKTKTLPGPHSCLDLPISVGQGYSRKAWSSLTPLLSSQEAPVVTQSPEWQNASRATLVPDADSEKSRSLERISLEASLAISGSTATPAQPEVPKAERASEESREGNSQSNSCPPYKEYVATLQPPKPSTGTKTSETDAALPPDDEAHGSEANLRTKTTAAVQHHHSGVPKQTDFENKSSHGGDRYAGSTCHSRSGRPHQCHHQEHEPQRRSTKTARRRRLIVLESLGSDSSRDERLETSLSSNDIDDAMVPSSRSRRSSSMPRLYDHSRRSSASAPSAQASMAMMPPAHYPPPPFMYPMGPYGPVAPAYGPMAPTLGGMCCHQGYSYQQLHNPIVRTEQPMPFFQHYPAAATTQPGHGPSSAMPATQHGYPQPPLPPFSPPSSQSEPLGPDCYQDRCNPQARNPYSYREPTESAAVRLSPINSSSNTITVAAAAGAETPSHEDSHRRPDDNKNNTEDIYSKVVEKVKSCTYQINRRSTVTWESRLASKLASIAGSHSESSEDLQFTSAPSLSCPRPSPETDAALRELPGDSGDSNGGGDAAYDEHGRGDGGDDKVDDDDDASATYSTLTCLRGTSLYDNLVTNVGTTSMAPMALPTEDTVTGDTNCDFGRFDNDQEYVTLAGMRATCANCSIGSLPMSTLENYEDDLFSEYPPIPQLLSSSNSSWRAAVALSKRSYSMDDIGHSFGSGQSSLTSDHHEAVAVKRRLQFRQSGSPYDNSMLSLASADEDAGLMLGRHNAYGGSTPDMSTLCRPHRSRKPSSNTSCRFSLMLSSTEA